MASWNPDYLELSEELCKEIEKSSLYNGAFCDRAVRRNRRKDRATVWRPDFIRDTEKIINCPYYNRYADKTQVFSFYKNDDISRRALHVQLVSRIARNIGRLLGLDLDLIEAIALGHDIGHTPFGHSGEKLLNDIYFGHTGRYFKHNLQSVRVLDKIFCYNMSLQTLDGILCHNGEFENKVYKPKKLSDFRSFDVLYETCCVEKDADFRLVPSTMEGCVVRICDIIAYLGKDRQDAFRAGVGVKGLETSGPFGYNAAIINNMTVNIVENSYGKDYICMDDEFFDMLKQAKTDNYRYIYESEAVSGKTAKTLMPMFEKIYEKVLNDIKKADETSPVYRHHIAFIEKSNKYYTKNRYSANEPNQIAVDYIASMTDDYFVDLYQYWFPDEKNIKYEPYF